MKEQTALQMVKNMLESDVTPKAILSWIESTGKAIEQKQIEDAVDFTGESAVKYLRDEISYNEVLKDEQYYRTKYGETDH